MNIMNNVAGVIFCYANLVSIIYIVFYAILDDCCFYQRSNTFYVPMYYFSNPTILLSVIIIFCFYILY